MTPETSINFECNPFEGVFRMYLRYKLLLASRFIWDVQEYGTLHKPPI